MPAERYELFLLRTDQHPTHRLVRRGITGAVAATRLPEWRCAACGAHSGENHATWCPRAKITMT